MTETVGDLGNVVVFDTVNRSFFVFTKTGTKDPLRGRTMRFNTVAEAKRAARAFAIKYGFKFFNKIEGTVVNVRKPTTKNTTRKTTQTKNKQRFKFRWF